MFIHEWIHVHMCIIGITHVFFLTPMVILGRKGPKGCLHLLVPCRHPQHGSGFSHANLGPEPMQPQSARYHITTTPQPLPGRQLRQEEDMCKTITITTVRSWSSPQEVGWERCSPGIELHRQPLHTNAPRNQVVGRGDPAR